MYHNLTKRHVARTLDLASWKEEFGIESVHLEQQITFERENESIPLQPDIHVVLKDGGRLYIEVVYKNPPKRLHHDLYGKGLAIIDLRDEANRVVLSSGDEDERIKCYRSWVREGGIEEALREELNLQRRQVLFRRRQENFERNNITVVKEYLSEVAEEPDTKWHLLSEESIQNLEKNIEEGMSKEMVRTLYLEILERQLLDKKIQEEIDRLSDDYETSGYTAKQFDAVEEVSPYIKQDFVDKIEAEIEIQLREHGFKIEFVINPKYRYEGEQLHYQVGSPQQVRGAYALEAPMRIEQFKMQEKSGFELNIQFQVEHYDVAVKGAEFYASKPEHITEIYKFALPILEEEKRCKEAFGFDANLEYTRSSLALDTILDDESPEKLHWIVKGANEVQMAYETEKEYRDEAQRRRAEWPQFLAQIKKDCEEILNPTLEEIRKHIEEQENSEQILPNSIIRRKTLEELSHYRYLANTHRGHVHHQLEGQIGTLPNYQPQLDEKCPDVLLHRNRTHRCFNLEFLGLNELLERYDRAKTDTLKGRRYTTSNAARVVRRMEGYLVNREEYFSRLLFVLERGGTRQWITTTEARRILEALEKWNAKWNTMERVERIDWCIENEIGTEDAMLNCLGLQKDSLTINGLSDSELLKQYYYGPFK